MTFKLHRRDVIKTGVAGGILASMPMISNADGHPKVVIIGGGIGGATVARYLAKQSEGKIDVTLVEANKNYVTCFFSNWHIAGFRTMESITQSYDKLSGEYGVKVVHAMATGVDAAGKKVMLKDGSSLPYDKLVVAPGIDFKWDSVAGYSEAMSEKLPHAYKAGPQTTILRDQLMAMKDGGTYAMIAPPNPFRCPPGPYERISLVANYLKKNKPKSKIIILDAKEKFSKQALFQEAWAKYYDGMVEWLPASIHGGVKNVAEGMVEIDGETIKADVINVIPAQKAGEIANIAGLTNDSGWCPIKDATSFASAQVDDVHVLGDASINGAMPKSGFSANSQAKNVAVALAAELIGSKKFPARFRNTCWSLVSDEDAVKVGASYVAEGDKVAKTEGFISKTGEDAALREQTKNEAVAWYDGITEDTFG